MKLTLPSTLAVLAVLVATPAAAQDRSGESDWTITLGASAAVVPEYEGSDEYRVVPWPLVDVVWRDRLFFGTRRGLGGYLWNDGGLKLGASVGYASGRDEIDGDRLRGLGDIDGGAAVSVFAEYEILNFTLGSRFTHQVTGDDTGYVVDLGVGYAFRFPQGVTVTPSISAEYASGEYMDTFFGVSPAQSARSGLATFDADAGFKSAGPELAVVYPFTQNVSVQGTAAYKRLLGDAADSPVIETEDQFSLGLGVAYRF